MPPSTSSQSSTSPSFFLRSNQIFSCCRFSHYRYERSILDDSFHCYVNTTPSTTATIHPPSPIITNNTYPPPPINTTASPPTLSMADLLYCNKHPLFVDVFTMTMNIIGFKQ
ncbi:hypothetical protein QL285_006233 [Trifolium repens]|nr:hypothetical protein QL285_006233 [Trifolium repens]